MGMAEEEGRTLHHDWGGLTDVETDVVGNPMGGCHSIHVV